MGPAEPLAVEGVPSVIVNGPVPEPMIVLVIQVVLPDPMGPRIEEEELP